jgi:signal transduction histidine kinase
MRETMKSTRRVALVGTTDVSLVPALAAEFARCGRNCFFLAASSLPQLRNQVVRGVPQVIVLDESILDGSATEEVFYALTAAAPVVFVASQETLISAAPLAADGDIECVARAGQYIPLAAAIVERRLRWLERAHASLGPPWAELPADFAEILRHEINNPLTGILGNAELLLAHRENLPVAAAQRLETVVDLAIRLRETVRRLSQMWESHHPAARSA